VAPAPPRLVVLQSFRQPRPTTNPYVSLLLRSLPEDVSALTFSWRRALLGRYDVLHLHWPDVLLRGTSTLRTLGRRALVAALLVRLVLARTAVVRTVHNPAPHERGPAVERLLLAALDRCTALAVHLSPSTADAVRPGLPGVVVPHGHYREWYTAADVRPVPGRLLHFGLLRPYKGVDALLGAFSATPGDLQLRVVGHPSSPALAEELTAAAAADPRVALDLQHAPDDALAAEIAAAELVVLPYRSMHNSGALLLALSLDRPVLVPETSMTTALAEEVGAGWVLTHHGEVSAQHLQEALVAVRAAGRSPRPDLSAREWPAAGAEHARAYRRAVAVRASRRRTA